jgi:hypothetical protein
MIYTIYDKDGSKIEEIHNDKLFTLITEDFLHLRDENDDDKYIFNLDEISCISAFNCTDFNKKLYVIVNLNTDIGFLINCDENPSIIFDKEIVEDLDYVCNFIFINKKYFKYLSVNEVLTNK